MRGEDQQQNHIFSYLSPEERVRKDHPLRTVRAMVDEVLQQLSRRFDAMYAKVGRPRSSFSLSGGRISCLTAAILCISIAMSLTRSKRASMLRSWAPRIASFCCRQTRMRSTLRRGTCYIFVGTRFSRSPSMFAGFDSPGMASPLPNTWGKTLLSRMELFRCPRTGYWCSSTVGALAEATASSGLTRTASSSQRLLKASNTHGSGFLQTGSRWRFKSVQQFRQVDWVGQLISGSLICSGGRGRA